MAGSNSTDARPENPPPASNDAYFRRLAAIGNHILTARHLVGVLEDQPDNLSNLADALNCVLRQMGQELEQEFFANGQAKWAYPWGAHIAAHDR